MDRFRTWLIMGSILAALGVGAAVPALAQDASDSSSDGTSVQENGSEGDDGDGRATRRDCDHDGGDTSA
jgi:hypothetical protein